ncbi:MAG TPA: hemolysin III family protein [Microthrixaceae bacterium]|nr:hemolysin III family protein [Microthrixaceae bacterium]
MHEAGDPIDTIGSDDIDSGGGPEGVFDALVKPSWRGRIHQAAFFLSIPAGLFLLAAAHSTAARVAVAVYWASLAGLFGASASYHRLARTPTSVKWLRRLDHSMIFVLIAGTYTPICLLVLPRVWGIPMLVVVWVTALAGVIMKMVRVTATSTRSGSWLYVVMGWGSVLVMPQLLANLDAARLILLGTGGLLYSVGVVVLASRRPNPRPATFGYHEIWHAMTVGAGACHFALIALVLK